MGLSIGGGLSGAAGGFAVGGPVGAGLGAIAGLFSGGNQEQQNRTVMRPFTRQEQEAVDRIMAMYPDALNQMSAEQREEVFNRTREMIRTEGIQQVERTFRQARGNMELGQARTGGSLGSISIYQTGELARQEGEARGSVERGAVLGADQVASNQQNEAFNRVNTLGGQYNSLWQNRVIGSNITGINNNPGGGGAAMLGLGLASPNSYFNRNYGSNQSQGDNP